MGNFLNEDVFLNKQASSFSKLLESRASRIGEKPPTYVTYYNINSHDSMTDLGFLDIEKSLGANSPLRYSEVKKFPIYGIEEIILELTEKEEGISTDYEGEGVLLPNTIKPLMNDLFIIDYLDIPILFIVNDIKFDTIRANNYYKIYFSIRRVDSGDQYSEVRKQVTKSFTCDIKNLGTNTSCLIEDDIYERINEWNIYKRNLIEVYDSMYFNKKYNSYLVPVFNKDTENQKFGSLLYDRYLTNFIQHNKLMNEENDITTRYLSNEDNDFMFIPEYERSIYRYLERKDIEGIKKCLYDDFKYNLNSYTNPDSVFKYYRVNDVNFIRFNSKMGPFGFEYIPELLLEGIQENLIIENNPLYNFIIDYMNSNIKSSSEIDLSFLKEINIRDYSIFNFISIPIVIFIIKKYIDEYSGETKLKTYL